MNPDFREFMKEQEKERNRKFLRHMVRLVRKTIGVNKKKELSPDASVKTKSQERAMVREIVDEILPKAKVSSGISMMGKMLKGEKEDIEVDTL